VGHATPSKVHPSFSLSEEAVRHSLSSAVLSRGPKVACVSAAVKMGKWAKYGKKYKKEWEKEDGLREWIACVPGDDSVAECKFCKTTIRAPRTTVILLITLQRRNTEKMQPHFRT